uniref:Peptidase S1 domain-containing protein n=1 Tax=Anopheles quadriannulatus TaxID=34691 RepID=A0A182X325_ANOQN
RWKGGLVYVDLIYENHIVPFVIGSASFAPISGLHRLHGFSKLSKFVDWISKIMREEGADVSFEPLICAKRHLEYRRQINNTTSFEPNIAVDTTVSIQSHPDAPHTKICAGVLIRKDGLWNGGLLHVDLKYANRFVPYIIGIDSIKVNKSHKPDVFLQISKFGDWITKTMRDEGEDISFDPLIINSTELNVPNKSIRYAVSIQPSPDGHQPKKCAGILLEKDIVVTLAQCASNLM